MEEIRDNLVTVIIGSVFLIVLMLVFFSFVFFYFKRYHRFQVEKQIQKAEFERVIASSQLEIQQQTLTNVARELHDNLGQIASLIKINLNTFPIHDSRKAAERLEETKDLLRTLIGDMKQLSVSLNGDRIVQAGLQKSIQTEINHLLKTGLYEIEFLAEGSIPALDANHTLILFRMVQELFNNMVKHGEAKHIKIKLIASDFNLTLVLSDDGKGFDVPLAMRREGSGLLNLQQRAKLIGADFSINSEPLNGSQVTIKLPLQNASDATSATSTR